MKLKIIYLFVLSGLISSCSDDFTDLSPASQRNVDVFYKTEGDLITAVNATYKALQLTGTYNQGYWIVNELRSDNTDAGSDIGGGIGPFLNAIDNFNEDATTEVVRDVYFDSYVGISRANIVLSRIEPVSIPELTKNRIKGEALFLRSLFYYNLAVNFGKLPLVLKEISVEEGKNYPQLPAADVYKQLITDLIQAESYLPIKYTGLDVGRATKGAAAALLAKIYLTTGEKASAVPVLRRIISTYSYTLLTDYSKLWGVANENNAESIFEVQFKGGNFGTGNLFTNAFTPLLRQTTGGYKNRPTTALEAAFETGDKRIASSFNPLNGPLNANRFILKYGTTNAFSEFDGDYNFPVLRYSDVYLLLAEALGETTESYDLINEVRAKHGGLGPISAATPGTFPDKLLHERQVEFAFENQRWPDLLRFGKASAVLQAQGKTARPLYFIPQRELDTNKQFSQNQ
jgi:hypothetical protein